MIGEEVLRTKKKRWINKDDSFKIWEMQIMWCYEFGRYEDKAFPWHSKNMECSGYRITIIAVAANSLFISKIYSN